MDASAVQLRGRSQMQTELGSEERHVEPGKCFAASICNLQMLMLVFLRWKAESLACELGWKSELLQVQAITVETLVDERGKLYASYTFRLTLKLEPSATNASAAPNGAREIEAEPESSARAQQSSTTSRCRTDSFTLTKRYKEMHEFHQYLQQKHCKLLQKNSIILVLPQRIFLDFRRYQDPSTVADRARIFATYLHTLFGASAEVRRQLFEDCKIGEFLLEPTRSSVRFRLCTGDFSNCISDLRALQSTLRFMHCSDTHQLAFHTLLSLVIVHTHADPHALAPEIIDELQAESDAETRRQGPRKLLLSAAVRYVSRAWLVLETCGSILFAGNPSVAVTYRDALACAIEWLSTQLGDPHLRSRVEASCGIRRPDMIAPRATISNLYKVVIRDNMP